MSERDLEAAMARGWAAAGDAHEGLDGDSGLMAAKSVSGAHCQSCLA